MVLTQNRYCKGESVHIHRPGTLRSRPGVWVLLGVERRYLARGSVERIRQDCTSEGVKGFLHFRSSTRWRLTPVHPGGVSALPDLSHKSCFAETREIVRFLPFLFPTAGVALDWSVLL